MKNILRFGINSNMLKTIALIAMVIDHIGFYFEPFLNQSVMLACRYIGRIAMPIFTYLIVQGFFHTKDLKKYTVRMFVWAIVTQLAIWSITFVNVKFVQHYTSANYHMTMLNVLFTYTISLILLKIIHEHLLVKKWDYNKNLSIKIICIILISIICILLPIDYNIEVPILAVVFYVIERLKIKFLINTEPFRNSINKIIKIDEYSVIKGIYVFLLWIAMLLVMIYFELNIWFLFAIIPIALYNGDKGNKSKILKNIFYVIFPLHHVLLYSLAMLIMLT